MDKCPSFNNQCPIKYSDLVAGHAVGIVVCSSHMTGQQAYHFRMHEDYNGGLLWGFWKTGFTNSEDVAAKEGQTLDDKEDEHVFALDDLE
ncbi:hypothetical protein Tco_0698665 [Tanacetum coccineum]